MWPHAIAFHLKRHQECCHFVGWWMLKQLRCCGITASSHLHATDKRCRGYRGRGRQAGQEAGLTILWCTMVHAVQMRCINFRGGKGSAPCVPEKQHPAVFIGLIEQASLTPKPGSDPLFPVVAIVHEPQPLNWNLTMPKGIVAESPNLGLPHVRQVHGG